MSPLSQIVLSDDLGREVVRRCRLRWFGHVERKSGDDWVSACRNVVRVRCAGRGRKSWYECVKDDRRCLVCMLNGQCSGICGGASFWEERLTLAELGKMDVLKINDGDYDLFFIVRVDHIRDIFNIHFSEFCSQG